MAYFSVGQRVVDDKIVVVRKVVIGCTRVTVCWQVLSRCCGGCRNRGMHYKGDVMPYSKEVLCISLLFPPLSVLLFSLLVSLAASESRLIFQ